MKYPQKPGFKARATAREAAKSAAPRALSLREKIFVTLKAAGRGGLTPDEIAYRLDESILSVRPRVSELAIIGRIEDTRARRVNEISGRRAIVWRVVK